MSPSEAATSSRRYRSVPYRTSYYLATFWTILHLFCVFSTLAAIVLFFLYYKSANYAAFTRIIVVGASCCVVTLILSYSKRRSARCPLCFGTPLHNSGALAHKRSFALGPLTEGFTAVLSIACTQKFRCMYCGTRYDLLKMSRSERKLPESE